MSLCYFRVYTDKNSSDVRRYLDATIKELKKYSKSSYLAGRKQSLSILEEAHRLIFLLSN